MSPARRVPEPDEYLDPLFDISAETVVVIKQILDRNDIYYKSKMLKADLVQLFHQKRLSMLNKHQANRGDIKMGEDQALTATSIKHRDAVGGEEGLLCQAKLARNGKKCGNPAHAGYLTCGIQAHRAQESQIAKASVQRFTGDSSNAESRREKSPITPENLTGQSSNNAAQELAGETRHLKTLLEAAMAENAHLKALYDTTAAENARLSQVVSSVRDENLRVKSTLCEHRAKVNRMLALFEELFGEDEIF